MGGGWREGFRSWLGHRVWSPATVSDAAIQACLTLKALFGLPLRQTTGLGASLLKLAGRDWAVPDFSTLPRRPSGLSIAIR